MGLITTEWKLEDGNIVRLHGTGRVDGNARLFGRAVAVAALIGKRPKVGIWLWREMLKQQVADKPE